MAIKKKQSADPHTLKRILSYIRPYRLMLVLSVLLTLVNVALTLYVPILIGDAIDYIIEKGNVDFEALGSLLIRFIVVVLFTALAQWFMNLFNNKITYCVVRDIRTDAFTHLQKLPVGYIDAHPYGDTISRIITDIDQFSDGLLMGFNQLFSGVLTILATLIFMLTINVKITLLVVILTPLSLFIAAFIAKNTFQMFKRQSEARGEITSLIDEMVGNQKIVQAFAYEEKAEKRFDVLNQKLEKCSLKAIFFSSLVNPSTRFVNSMVYAAVGIFGAVTVISRGMTVGALTKFLSYANQYTKPFNEISGVVTEFQNALASASRVFELIDEPSFASDAPNALELSNVQGHVELKNVYFSYVKDKPLIENFNLNVKPGQRIAIVGPTGCGKSTMINLLMRFYDTDSGSIEIDGHSIYEVTRSSIRKNYGMVLQETWLKSGTIRENICYGKPDATQEEILQAAKTAHAHSFIKRMPQGYDTVISEDGGNLSQGQKQLLCIARVLLSLPPMLILDEATSSIDTRTEIKIQKAFAHMMKGRTSFIVAHRLSTIKEADCILVMENGHIVEQGTHEELLARKGFYANLYNSQFQVY